MTKPHYLHPDDIEMFEYIRKVSFLTSVDLGLNLKEVVAKRRPLCQHTGICYHEERIIRIAVRSANKCGANPKWWAKRNATYDSIWVTCHELSHLRFVGHSKAQSDFHHSIIEPVFLNHWTQEVPEGFRKAMAESSRHCRYMHQHLSVDCLGNSELRDLVALHPKYPIIVD